MIAKAQILVPLNEDLGVYARSVSAFLSQRTVTNYAIMVLAQRVVVERVRAQRSPRRRAQVYELIDKINTEADYRARMAADPGKVLHHVHTAYRAAALIFE